MKPELIAAVAESNVVEAERAREAAEKTSTLDMVGDTATQLD